MIRCSVEIEPRVRLGQTHNCISLVMAGGGAERFHQLGPVWTSTMNGRWDRSAALAQPALMQSSSHIRVSVSHKMKIRNLTQNLCPLFSSQWSRAKRRKESHWMEVLPNSARHNILWHEKQIFTLNQFCLLSKWNIKWRFSITSTVTQAGGSPPSLVQCMGRCMGKPAH